MLLIKDSKGNYTTKGATRYNYIQIIKPEKNDKGLMVLTDRFDYLVTDSDGMHYHEIVGQLSVTARKHFNNLIKDLKNFNEGTK